MDVDLRSLFPEVSTAAWVLLFVGVEHAFLAVRVAIDKMIPDESKAVKFAMDRDDFVLKTRARSKAKSE